jgi:hypothetical protein
MKIWKPYKRLFEEEDDFIISKEEEKILLGWFIGIDKDEKTLKLFKKIQKYYPVEKGYVLYRAVRIPKIENKKGDIIIIPVSKPGVTLSSWTENFKSALDIFNRSRFYDEIDGFTSVIVSSKIEKNLILTNYKVIKLLIEKNNLEKLNKIFKKWYKEKEYVVLNKSTFKCELELVGKFNID